MIEDVYYIVTCYFITYGYKRGEKQVAVFLVDEGIKKAPEVPGLFCVLGVILYMGFQGNFIYPASIVVGVLNHHPYNYHMDPCLHYR